MTATSTVAAPGAGPALPPPAMPPRWLPFEWLLALRFLQEGAVQSLFIVGGVAIGVGVIVFMSALLTGLQANFVNKALTGQAQVQLLPAKDTLRTLHPASDQARGVVLQAAPQRVRSIDQWQSVLAFARAQPGVRVVSPVASGAVLALRGSVTRGISVVGVEPETYFQVVPVPAKLVRGRTRLSATDILVGTELASDLGVDVGDRIQVAVAGSGGLSMTITGIFDLGNKAANGRTTFIALRTAQSLLGLPGGVSAIEITLADVYAADAVAQRIAAATGVRADSWIRTNQEFFTAVRAQTTANTAIRVLVALSVAFGIASVLVVSVVQRSREIGILRAMGISRAQVMRMFLLQGGLLGFSGAMAGMLLGAGALLLFVELQRNPDGTPLFPVLLEPMLFVLSLLLATLTGLLAALAPAMRAARLDPVVAIRG